MSPILVLSTCPWNLGQLPLKFHNYELCWMEWFIFHDMSYPCDGTNSQTGTEFKIIFLLKKFYNLRPCGKGKYQSTNNTKIEIERVNFYQKNEKISRWKPQTHWSLTHTFRQSQISFSIRKFMSFLFLFLFVNSIICYLLTN